MMSSYQVRGIYNVVLVIGLACVTSSGHLWLTGVKSVIKGTLARVAVVACVACATGLGLLMMAAAQLHNRLITAGSVRVFR
jgi:apolipoprotein N-acyltransferase